MSWPVVPLTDVAEVRLGRQRAPKNHSGDWMRPYIRAANVTWAGLDLSDVKTMNFTDAEMATYRMEPGDIVLSEASGSPGEVGKPALWSGEISDCAFQNTLIRVRPREHDPKFLVHYFRYLALDGQFVEYSRGVGIHHIGRARLASWPTPLPPIDEQHRIVSLLEDHLSRLDAAEISARDGLRRTATLRKAHLREAFDQRAAELRPLLDVASIANGQTPKGLVEILSSEPGDDAVPFFKVGDMNAADGRWMNDARFFVSRESAERLGLHVHPAGTVLIPKRGGAIATNKKRILKFPAAYDLNTMGLVPNDSLDSSYLWHWLQTVDLGRIADGSNVPQINATQIRELQLPVPELQAQLAAANRLDEIDEGLTRLAEQVESVRRRGGGLRRALLSAAFSGRLTGDAATDLSEAEEMVGA